VVSPAASVRRGDRVVAKTTSGEVMAKQVGRLTSQRVELKSLNKDYDDRAFQLSELAFMHRILWSSQ
jgi:phage repressor protein C with HTH and peptisase S24 domain